MRVIQPFNFNLTPEPRSASLYHMKHSYTRIDKDGAVDIVYVTPCGEAHLMAHISAKEMQSKNPGVEFLVPVIGLNGLRQIAKLLDNVKLG
jgi:hypothetical protein